MQAFYTAALRKALHFQLLMGDFYTYLAVGMRGCAGGNSGGTANTSKAPASAGARHLYIPIKSNCSNEISTS